MSGCQSYLTNVYMQNPPLRATKNLLNALVLFHFVCFGGQPALLMSTQDKKVSLCNGLGNG